MKMDKIEFLEDGINVNGKFLKLTDIITNVNLAKARTYNLGLMIIEWPETRGCDAILERICRPVETLKKIKSIICGKTVYFGEIAGKHSDVFGEVDDDEIVIHEDPESVNRFLSECPGGHEYNHSFLEAFNKSVESEMIEFSENELIEFKDLIA
jgi:hypothetical protein